jgi:hypothetical protein
MTGRGGGIRTRDPLHPMQVRYQAALRPDDQKIITEQAARSGSDAQEIDDRGEFGAQGQGRRSQISRL